jgi:quercetin dioxygenase-like cupin family protein
VEFIDGHTLTSRAVESDCFTGHVWRTQAVGGDTSSGMRASRFVYEPGARSSWHTHDHEQVLLVEVGCGVLGIWGESEGRRVVAGDWVHVAPGEKHWHGAQPDSTLVHVAVNAGGAAHWLEAVSDETYRRATRRR